MVHHSHQFTIADPEAVSLLRGKVAARALTNTVARNS
jgi:hypothetical protein